MTVRDDFNGGRVDWWGKGSLPKALEALSWITACWMLHVARIRTPNYDVDISCFLVRIIFIFVCVCFPQHYQILCKPNCQILKI